MSPSKTMPDNTFTKTELLRAIGEPYQSEGELWLRRIEQWTDEGVLCLIGEETRNRRGRKHYPQEEVYIAAVLFRMKAIGFQLSTIASISYCLHANLEDRDRNNSAFINYWNAAKHGELAPILNSLKNWKRGEPFDPNALVPESPVLIVALMPNAGRGFGSDVAGKPPGDVSFSGLEAFVTYGREYKAPHGCTEVRLDLSEVFAPIRLAVPPLAA